MSAKLSRWGVGPQFALLSIVYTGLLELTIRLFRLHVPMNFLPHFIFVIIAAILIFVGIPFFIFALASVHRAYNANKLVTTGIFGLCRNPVYASWVVFFVPAIMLVRGNWLGLTVPVFMYFILRVFVKKEEIVLESVFGEEYALYKKRVMCIMPLSPLRNWAIAQISNTTFFR